MNLKFSREILFPLLYSLAVDMTLGFLSYYTENSRFQSLSRDQIFWLPLYVVFLSSLPPSKVWRFITTSFS